MSGWVTAVSVWLLMTAVVTAGLAVAAHVFAFPLLVAFIVGSVIPPGCALLVHFAALAIVTRRTRP